MQSFQDLTPRILCQQVIFNMYIEQVAEAILMQIAYRSHSAKVLPNFI